jgi:hypothetical protein
MSTRRYASTSPPSCRWKRQAGEAELVVRKREGRLSKELAGVVDELDQE